LSFVVHLVTVVETIWLENAVGKGWGVHFPKDEEGKGGDWGRVEAWPSVANLEEEKRTKKKKEIKLRGKTWEKKGFFLWL
jgi:hypothetical protein